MALFLFRVFDMWKPWPVSAVERLGGGFGIVADDIVAGIIAAAILYGMLAIRLV
jgi:phosphatidylglycerophosphatase A